MFKEYIELPHVRETGIHPKFVFPIWNPSLGIQDTEPWNPKSSKSGIGNPYLIYTLLLPYWLRYRMIYLISFCRAAEEMAKLQGEMVRFS